MIFQSSKKRMQISVYKALCPQAYAERIKKTNKKDTSVGGLALKIRIITIHGIPNFGSVFQSYALCEYLKSQGYTEVEIIDYNPTYYKSKSLRAFVGKILNFGSYLRRTRKFREFIEQNLPLSSNSTTLFSSFNNSSKVIFSILLFLIFNNFIDNCVFSAT